MKKFKIGDSVRIIKSLNSVHVGEITIITSELRPFKCDGTSSAHNNTHCYCYTNFKLIHEVNMSSIYKNITVVYPPEWLEPYWEGKEKSNQTLDEIINSIKSIKKSKEVVRKNHFTKIKI